MEVSAIGGRMPQGLILKYRYYLVFQMVCLKNWPFLWPVRFRRSLVHQSLRCRYNRLVDCRATDSGTAAESIPPLKDIATRTSARRRRRTHRERSPNAVLVMHRSVGAERKNLLDASIHVFSVRQYLGQREQNAPPVNDEYSDKMTWALEYSKA